MSAGRRSEQVEVFGRGRVCAAESCDTVLSTYNPLSFCEVHKSCEGPPRSRIAGSDRPAAARVCRSAACGRAFRSSNPLRRYCDDHCRADAFHKSKRPTEDGDAPR